MLIATDDVIRGAESIYRDFEVAKLQAYRARPGNPNRIEITTFGGAVATLGPYVGYFNRVYGFTSKQISCLREIIGFYGPSQTDFELTVSPLDASPDVGEALIDHGFRPAGYHSKFFFDLIRWSGLMDDSGIVISPVGADDVEAFLETMMEGWGIAPENWAGAKDNMRLRFGIPGVSLWWGSVRGRNIGGAVLYLREGDGYLADASTIPSARRQGCQVALIRARMEHAHALGCRRLFGGAPFGSASARNMQRAGLNLAASDMAWRYRFSPQEES